MQGQEKRQGLTSRPHSGSAYSSNKPTLDNRLRYILQARIHDTVTKIRSFAQVENKHQRQLHRAQN